MLIVVGHDSCRLKIDQISRKLQRSIVSLKTDNILNLESSIG